MMMKALLIGGIALLALAGCNKPDGTASAAAEAPIARIAAPAGTDWTTTVAQTPDGGFRMGNPNAKVKLIEYGSLSCPACARFAGEGIEPLKANYIATGQVSYEFRPYLLHAQDLMASTLVQCGGSQPFFTIMEQMYASQEDWLGKIQALPPAELQQLSALPVAQQTAKLADASGLIDFIAARGVSRATAAQCIADKQTPDKLLAMRNRANTEFELAGTPTFIINGETVPNAAGWAALEPAVRAALS